MPLPYTPTPAPQEPNELSRYLDYELNQLAGLQIAEQAAAELSRSVALDAGVPVANAAPIPFQRGTATNGAVLNLGGPDITVPRSGFYQIMYAADGTPQAGGAAAAALAVNGSIVAALTANSFAGAGNPAAFAFAGLIQLQAGDVLDVRMGLNSLSLISSAQLLVTEVL